MCEKAGGANAERQVVSALALMEEFISDHLQLEFKENQDAGPVTEVAVLKVNDAYEIRDHYRAIFEIPETRMGLSWG